MRVPGVWVGLLGLFVFVHGLKEVSIICSEHWLQVRIKREPYLNNQQLQSHEVLLGTGCPVTAELRDYFEFFYLLSSCGIKVEVRPWGTLIESSVTYEPTDSDLCGHLPISCFIQRKFTFSYKKKTKGNSNNGNKTSVGKKKSTSSQVENSRTQRSFLPRGSPKFYPSRLSTDVKLLMLNTSQLTMVLGLPEECTVQWRSE